MFSLAFSKVYYLKSLKENKEKAPYFKGFFILRFIILELSRRPLKIMLTSNSMLTIETYDFGILREI